MGPSGDEIRIGISSCLLGENVRFDGGHKRDAFLVGTLAPLVTFVPVCPEVGIGLGTPRESLRLERARADGAARLRAPKSGTDHTAAMRAWAKDKVAELARSDLCGFILKKDSPSCGFLRVRVYDRNGVPKKDGRGLFADALLEALPRLPVEDEGRLNDPGLRENFFVRVFAYRRLKDLLSRRWGPGDLVAFHTREKLLLRAHHEPTYRELGRLVAGVRGAAREDLARRYGALFLDALSHRATVRRNFNVLQHCAGYLREALEPDARAELHGVLEDYRSGLVPLVVPITLLRHHVRMQGIGYLAGQSYLEPHPKELLLRNHV